MEERIIKIIEKLKGREMPELNSDSSIINDYRLDSLETVNFYLNLEDEFDIIIDFENFDFELLSSVNKLAEYIRNEIGR